MIECKYCGKRHRTYKAVAKCKFPKAEWIEGEGRYGCLAFCDVLTIKLWPTKAEAEQAKASIDSGKCGGKCVKNHKLWTF